MSRSGVEMEKEKKLADELRAARERIRELEQECAALRKRSNIFFKSKDKALENYVAYLRNLLTTIPDLIWLKDAEGRYLTCNVAFEQFFGATEEEIIGKTDYDFVSRDLADFFRKNDLRAMNAGKSRVNEEELVFARDGYKGLFETIKTPMCDADRNVIGILGIARDISARKHVEEDLRESEERFRQVYENMAVGVVRVSLDSVIESANEAFCNMVGYAEDDLVGMNVLDVSHPDLPQENLKKQALLAAGKIDHFRLQKRFIHKSGRIVHGILDASLVRGSDGAPRHFLGSVLDITDRIVAEDRLRESEAILHDVVDGSPVPTFVIGRDHSVVYWNRALEKISGVPASQVGGTRSHWRAFYPQARPCLCDLVLEEDEDALSLYYESGSITEGLVPGAYEASGYFPSLGEMGKWLHFTAAPIKDQRGRIIGAMETLVDITEQKRGEEGLLRAKSEFESIFENSQVGIMLLGGGRFLVRGNAKLAEMFGYDDPEEMRGISMRRLHLDEAHFSDYGKRFYSPLAKSEQIQVEYRMKRKDGSPIWCSLSGKALDPADLDKGVIWVVYDLEPRKAMENELRQARNRAEAANRAKSEFLANMSHEIRTPLNGLMGMLQLMQISELDEENTQYVVTALSSCRRLAELLGDILDLSKIEAGRLSLQHKTFSPRDVIESVHKLFLSSATQSGLGFEVHVDESVPSLLLGDASRLQQVLHNLVGNALKFTECGKIEMHAQYLAAHCPETCRVLFSVSDTGIGIPDAKLNALFTPFTQVSEGYTRDHQGAGLGLSICRRLVEAMGGNISMESEQGRGTTVYFSLPFQEAEPLPGEDEDAPGQRVPAGLRVLLVEDDRISRYTAQRQMQTLGYRVRTAEDGQEALQTLRDHDFDVVVMDLQMPVMDGVEATGRIRRGEAGTDRKDIPIIAMTAYSASDLEAGFERSGDGAGVNGYLEKPVEVGALRDVLRQVLLRRG